MIFIERMIKSILAEGLQEFIDNPVKFKEFLIDGGLTETEAAEQQAFFEETPPNIILGHARTGDGFPLWVIMLGSETTDQDYLDEAGSFIDENGSEYIDDHGNPIDYHIRRWAHSYPIITMTTHPDVTLYYYYLSKYIMQEKRTRLQDLALDEITFSGNELTPDEKYLPSDLFVRQLVISLKSDDSYRETYRPGVGLGKRIEGIHSPEEDTDEDVDIGGPAGDAGVKTNIRTY